MKAIEFTKLPSSAETGSASDPAALVEDKRAILGAGVAAIIYRHDAVVVERNFNGAVPPSENLKELRLFNPTGELKLWRQADGFRYRLRLENGNGPEAECFDQTHLTWDDQRRVDFDLPECYTVRNYVEFDDDGIIRFVDARLVGFEG